MAISNVTWSNLDRVPNIGARQDIKNAFNRTINAINAGNAELTTGAGTGVTAGTGTVYETSVLQAGNIITTDIILDLTGLDSVATDNDIIGVGAGAAHLGQITAAQNGTIFGGQMVCLETPAGGEVDFNLWSADEATGVLGALITGLTGELTVVDRAGDWAAGDIRSIGAVVPAANQYLYLAVGTSSTPTAGTYTAGKYLIRLFGYA
jgi:hypothetical protein